jgi:hypothetical protein
VRAWEYADLKTALAGYSAGDQSAPPWTDLGLYSTVHFNAYPDLEKMLAGTEFGFLLDAPADAPADERLEFGGEFDTDKVFSRIDAFYYKTLIAFLRKTPARECASIRRILAEEISLKNASWALRLRCYYNFSGKNIEERLIHLKMSKKGPDLADDALAVLDWKPDDAQDWARWKRRSLLNPEEAGKLWRVNPRYFQNAASIRLYKLTSTLFRRRPFTLDATALFIRLKQFEQQLLVSMAEGSRLGLSAGEVMAALGVKP